MFDLINQLMQSQMPSGPTQGQASSMTLGQMFQDPSQLGHQPIEMPAMPKNMSFKKMTPGFAQTKEGQDQAAAQIRQNPIAPEDQIALQAQGKRTMLALNKVKA